MRDFGFHHIARGHSGKVVIGLPFGRRSFAVCAGVASFERLEHHAAITEVFVFDLIEIVHAAVEGHVAAPPIGIFSKGDGTACFKCAYRVGARSDGRLQGRGSEIFALPLRFLQNRAQAED